MATTTPAAARTDAVLLLVALAVIVAVCLISLLLPTPAAAIARLTISVLGALPMLWAFARAATGHWRPTTH